MTKLWLGNRAAKTALIALIIFAACSAMLPSMTQAQQKSNDQPRQEDFRWRGRLKPGMSIQIKGVSGTIRAERASTDEIEVVALKRGTGNLNEVKVQASEYGGGVIFCAVYPDWDTNHSYDCRPTSDKASGDISAEVNGTRANIKFPGGGGGEIRLVDVRVDFIVRVPQGIRFVGHTVYGDVNARSLESDVIAHSVFGNVLVDLPAAAGASVQARTMMGGISSEFPLRFKSGSYAGQSATGRIGNGQRRFDLNSVMGSIGLRHAR
jgi:hypothetical protein